MRKWILMLVLLVAAAGCGQMEATVLTGQYRDVEARVGVESEGIHAGVIGAYKDSSTIGDGPSPMGGVYVTIDASWDVNAMDTPEPAPVPFSWLEELHAKPYVGVKLVDYVNNGKLGNLQPDWIFGTRFSTSPENPLGVVVEYVDGDTERDLYIGAQYRF